MMLSIQDLSCRYRVRKKETLSHIDFSLQEGEMVLLAGRSGCGKSTLIKLVTGLLGEEEAERTGRIFLAGRDTAQLSPEEIGELAGTVYQTPDDQLFAMTVKDEVGFALENRGEAPEKIAEEVARALEKTGLSGMGERSIHALSGGQRQRLALASVLVTHPRLLILDEPVSQMNPQGVADFLALLRKLNEEDGMTILVVEHRVNELAEHFPRLAVMHDGCIIYDGRTEDAWAALGDAEQYGIRLPQTVRLGEMLGLSALSSSVEKTAEAIRCAGISFAKDAPSETKPPAGEALLACSALAYTYPGNREETLHGISFTLRRGTINAVMGFNGAGKSTLMDLVGGLSEASAGSMRLEGAPVGRRLQRIGYMRQEADLMLLTDTVSEEMRWNNRTLSDAELEKLLRTLHLYHYRHDFPLALSKGQRLRAVFGAMLARRDNTLLLLDEPTTGQDQKSLSEIKRLLRLAADEGRTVLFITHDTEMAAELADRVLLLAGGRLIADGTPHEILSDRKLLAAGGLSVPPMLALSEMLGIAPCITAEEVMRHVDAAALGRDER